MGPWLWWQGPVAVAQAQKTTTSFEDKGAWTAWCSRRTSIMLEWGAGDLMVGVVIQTSPLSIGWLRVMSPFARAIMAINNIMVSGIVLVFQDIKNVFNTFSLSRRKFPRCCWWEWLLFLPLSKSQGSRRSQGNRSLRAFVSKPGPKPDKRAVPTPSPLRARWPRKTNQNRAASDGARFSGENVETCERAY